MNIRDEVKEAVDKVLREREERNRQEREQELAKRRDDLRSGIKIVLGRETFAEEMDVSVPGACPSPMAIIDGYPFVACFDKDAHRWAVRLVWQCPRDHAVWLPRNRYSPKQELGAYGATSIEDLAEHFEQYDHYAAHPDECPHCKDAATED